MSADGFDSPSCGNTSDPISPDDASTTALTTPEVADTFTVSVAATNVRPGEDGKARSLDWKLDAEELSLIRREEERVMKPVVLARLLAAGAALDCESDPSLLRCALWSRLGRIPTECLTV